MTSLNANALTTLDAVKLELGLSSSEFDDDDYICSQINFASALIEDFIGRKLAYESGVVERVAGYGGNRIHVTKKLPIIGDITSIEFTNGAAVSFPVDVADVRIENAEIGSLYYRGGFPWTVPRQLSTLSGDPLPGQEDQPIEVTYDGGWVLPASTPTGEQVALPLAIERACILVTTQAYNRRGDDRSISGERLMSYSVTYVGAGSTATQFAGTPFAAFPPDVIAMLTPYRCIPQSSV